MSQLQHCGLTLSLHAQTRAQQRGIPRRVIDMIGCLGSEMEPERFGMTDREIRREIEAREAEIALLRRSSSRHRDDERLLREEISALEMARRRMIVVVEGAVVTTFRRSWSRRRAERFKSPHY